MTGYLGFSDQAALGTQASLRTRWSDLPYPHLDPKAWL
jgi:hypothetical protein